MRNNLRIMVISAILMSVCIDSFSQRLNYGIEVGPMLNKPSDCIAGLGFSVGCFAEYRLKDSENAPFIYTGLKFEDKHYKNDNSLIYGYGEPHSDYCDITVTPYYLTLPIHIGGRTEWAEKDISFIYSIGPYFSYGLFGDYVVKTPSTEYEQSETALDISCFTSTILKRFDWGLSLNAGVELSEHYRVMIYASKGFTKIDHTEDFKHLSCSLMFGYKF